MFLDALSGSPIAICTTFVVFDMQTDRQTFLFNIWKNQISRGGEWSQGLRVILPRSIVNKNWPRLTHGYLRCNKIPTQRSPLR